MPRSRKPAKSRKPTRPREPAPVAHDEAAGGTADDEAAAPDGEVSSQEPEAHDEPGEPEPAALEDDGPAPAARDLADLPEADGGEGEAPDVDEPAEPRALAPVFEAGRRSLARFDPLTQYMNEIRRYPLLSREEEHALAVHYTKTGDVDAARRLITSNLRLVVKIAHEYRRAHRNLLDLVQEGNLGLLQAVQKYDPYRGVKLSSYAAWWIRAYILKFILNNWRLVKIGTTQAQRKLFFNLRKEKEKLERLGFAPEAKLLAERLDVSEAEVDEMERRLGSGELSLDAPLGRDDESGQTHLDMLESPGSDRPDVAAEGDEFRALLRQKLEAFERTLRGREQTIFHERLHAESPLTLQEIGERYSISRERARQLEKRLTNKLRDYLRRELGDAVQIAMGLEE
jgi:RNA polymerase sigma-32 factor